MKKHKGILLILGVSLLVFLVVFMAYSYEQRTTMAMVGKPITEVGTQSLEVSTLEPGEYAEISQNYVQRYGLEEVDKPKKRNDAQILERIAELAEEYELVHQVYENVELYTMDVLDHLANNPEMAAFALGTLEADGCVYGGYTDYELESDYPLLLQYDPRWGYFRYGKNEMGLSGCGPTCLAMTILALTDYEDVTPDKIAAYSLENEYYVPGTGTAWALMDDVPVLYGLSVTHPIMKEEEMKAELDAGKILICSVRRGVFTAEGHFIMIYGYDETGFQVNDPKCVARSNKTWDYREFRSQLKKIWAIGA